MTHANQSSLTFDFNHEFDEETDTKIKESIRSLLTSSEQSAQDTANDIARQFRVGQHYPGGYVDQVGDTVIYVSKWIPADHIVQDWLIDLVKEVRELPPQTNRPRWQSFLADNGIMSIVEAFYGGLEVGSLDNPQNEVGRQQWRSFSAFLARLTHEIDDCNCSGLAIFAFREALEEPVISMTSYAVKVLVISDWLRLAGVELFRSLLTDGKGESLWHGESGYSTRRWEFWQKRLQELSSEANVELETRDVVRQSQSIIQSLLGSEQ